MTLRRGSNGWDANEGSAVRTDRAGSGRFRPVRPMPPSAAGWAESHLIASFHRAALEAHQEPANQDQRENKGDLWVLSSGLDLHWQLPIVCADFRTRSLASVQNLGH